MDIFTNWTSVFVLGKKRLIIPFILMYLFGFILIFKEKMSNLIKYLNDQISIPLLSEFVLDFSESTWTSYIYFIAAFSYFVYIFIIKVFMPKIIKRSNASKKKFLADNENIFVQRHDFEDISKQLQYSRNSRNSDHYDISMVLYKQLPEMDKASNAYTKHHDKILSRIYEYKIHSRYLVPFIWLLFLVSASPFIYFVYKVFELII